MQVDVKYLNMSVFHKAIAIVERADLVSQDPLERRCVLYRKTLADFLEEWEEAEIEEVENFDSWDMHYLKEVYEEDKDGMYTDWYIFD